MRKLLASIFLLAGAFGLSAETYIVTEHGPFVCKDSDNLKEFVFKIAEFSNEDMSSDEEILTMLGLLTTYPCIFLQIGQQIHIADDAESIDMSFFGEIIPASSAEVINETRKVCLLAESDNCAIVT